MELFFPFLMPGAKERSHQQKKHSSFEDELSEVLGKQDDQADVKGQCRLGWTEAGAGGNDSSGYIGVRSLSYRPCKAASISFPFQMGKLRPRESVDLVGGAA